MADEPSSGEVARLIGLVREDFKSLRQEFNTRLDKLVSQDAFDAERRRVDERFANIGQDVVEERTARLAAEAMLNAKATATGLWIRWGVGLVLGIPSAILGFIALTTVGTR